MGLTRTFLEGHDETLGWQDFQGSVPANRSGGDDAECDARFDLAYDYDWDDNPKSRGYRVDHVQVKVILNRPNMWAVKASRTPALLKHEQGHYDIVALVGRDLYNELTGWDSTTPPKRFRKETDLKNAVDGLSRKAKALAARLAGTSSRVGVYDTQTKHMQDAKAQDEWNKALESARTNGTRLTGGPSGLTAGKP
jgi:hypothetical protein